MCDKSFKEKVIEIIDDNWKKAQEEKIYGKHWEYTKFLIRNMAIKRGKELAKEKRAQSTLLRLSQNHSQMFFPSRV